MPHIECEQLGFEDDGCSGNEIVRIIDAAMASSVLTGQQAGRPGDGLVHGNPRKRGEELFEVVTLVVPDASQQLEPDHFAGDNRLTVVEHAAE